MLEGNTLTVIITGVSTVVTALIPLAAKFSAGRSEAVKAASMTRQSDIELLKELLRKCTAEKNELVKLIGELPKGKGDDV